MDYKLRMTTEDHISLKNHLLPKDGKEAIAFALCGRLTSSEVEIYTIHSLHLYPYSKCTVRFDDRVEWSPAEITFLLEDCRKRGFTLLKIHSHPTNWPYFSQTDNDSDFSLHETIEEWTGEQSKLISAIMFPDGSISCRIITDSEFHTMFKSIMVIGDEVTQCNFSMDSNQYSSKYQNEQLRTIQAFGEGTINLLSSMTVGIVGCSGTGSIVAELLGRLGVGNIILVDFDVVEAKNLNRIINSTKIDADSLRYKVDVLKSAIDAMGTGSQVSALRVSLYSKTAYESIAKCDFVFGCMDSIDGRHLLNRISSYYCIPYIDIGVRLDADGTGGINEILGRIDYIKPKGSSLLSRGRYSLEDLKAADLKRTNPSEYYRQREEKYIKNADVESPAVISINMLFSSQAVNEFLARVHPFRDLPNGKYASFFYSLSGSIMISEPDGNPDLELYSKVGLGTTSPLLGQPMLFLG